ncbi:MULTISPECIES: hypothetical protein [Actinomycetes]|uniref:ABC transporter n=1 Tax=Saccharothrix algeriensis TaxID=173560 RepID=A0ABS2S0H9_9PSEU|nr:hypothetical protein [Saccharothrix algeriensis]
MSAVVTQGLRKRFGRTQALDGLDLTVRAGEVHGLLGPTERARPPSGRYGLAPRLASAARAALVAFLLITEPGPLLEIDQRLLDLSPFTHVPELPGAASTATPLLALLTITALLTTAGLLAFRRRDIA